MTGCRVAGTFATWELPEDLEKHAKVGIPRKVGRLLERAFYAPFVAATELHRRTDVGADLESFALFSVSNWDPSIPVPAFAAEDAPDLVERLSHFYTHPANPTDWLRRMPNNPLCNICITTGFRGPTMHYTGDADALSMMTVVAASTLEAGTASAAIVVAFDLPPGAEHRLAEDSDSTACAVLLVRDDRPGPDPDDLLRSIAAGPSGITAVAAMDSFIAGARR
jgi:hypothetical protein